MSLEAFNALLKYMPGASEAEIEAARKLIEIGNRPVDGTMDAVFDVAAYIDAACKNGCPPDIAMAPIKLGVSGLKVASELIRSGRFKEALSLFGSGVKNWVKGSDNVSLGKISHSLPEGWVATPSKKGGGVLFKDPSNPHNSIREMPGNPNSPNPAQRNPYVVFKKDGQAYDMNGNPLKNADDPAAHIPLDKFDMSKMPKF
ncbi:hypothetical protein [Leptospira alexanderi]|nr:hypothetical protein [Leptospira alexanderi]